MSRNRSVFAHRVRSLGVVLAIGAIVVAEACSPGTRGPSLVGDWDAYLADGSTARPGFEGWRRMGFAHFENSDSGPVGSIHRRTGQSILDVTHVAARSDSLVLSGS